MTGEAIEVTAGEPAEFQRPTLAEVREVLRRYGALIVHFSSVPAMKSTWGSELSRAFPEDLQYAACAPVCREGLCCSTVKPTDKFGTWANASGCVGLILGVTGPKSIRDVDPEGCGSFALEPGGPRVFPNEDRDITAAVLEETIVRQLPDGYNEWGVRDFEVLGIFAVSPFEVIRDGVFTDLGAIAKAFPTQRIYSFVDGRLVRREGDAWVEAEHGELYP